MSLVGSTPILVQYHRFLGYVKVQLDSGRRHRDLSMSKLRARKSASAKQIKLTQIHLSVMPSNGCCANRGICAYL